MVGYMIEFMHVMTFAHDIYNHLIYLLNRIELAKQVLGSFGVIPPGKIDYQFS